MELVEGKALRLRSARSPKVLDYPGPAKRRSALGFTRAILNLMQVPA